jgi:hypothetical protein
MARPDLPPFLQNYTPRKPNHTVFVDIQSAYNDPNSTELAQAWYMTMPDDAYTHFQSLNAAGKGEFLMLNPTIRAAWTKLEMENQVSSLPSSQSPTGQLLYLRAFELTYEEFVKLEGRIKE